VWAGNFDGRSMRDTLAIRSATPLWAAVIHELLTNDHPVDPPSARLARCEICGPTGLLPSRFSTGKTPELFFARDGADGRLCFLVFGRRKIDIAEPICRLVL